MKPLIRAVAQQLPVARRLFFSPKGRLRRKTFWAAALGAWLVFWLAYWAVDGLSPLDLTRLPALLLLWSLFCLCAKRYHDLDRSARWLALLLVPLLGVVWVCIELGFRRGTVGPNSFAPDPRETAGGFGPYGRDYATVG